MSTASRQFQSITKAFIFWVPSSGAVVNTVASQQEGSGFKMLLGQDISVWSLHILLVPMWVLASFLPQSQDMHNRLTDDSKLTLGVCVSGAVVHLCMALWWTGELTRMYLFHPMSAGSFQPPHLSQDKLVHMMDGYILIKPLKMYGDVLILKKSADTFKLSICKYFLYFWQHRHLAEQDLCTTRDFFSLSWWYWWQQEPESVNL